MIYLDHNASTPVDPEVADVVYSVLRTNFGNPSSGHDIGIKAKTSMEKARLQVAELIGASPEEVVFTSGGTESNNLAIIGSSLKNKKGHIITSVIEHPSVTNPCAHLQSMGFDCTYVRVDHDGMAIVEDIRKAIRKETFLITLMHANNETGVLQPIEEIGALAREKGISFHTDAAQTVGKVPVNVEKLQVDMLTIATHKFYGPKGVGALYIRKGVELSPLLFGAGHERGLRPGTENVACVAGLGKACEMAGVYMKDRTSHTKRLTSMLCTGLRERIPGLRINGHETLRLPNTLNICIPGINSSNFLGWIKDSVAASSGSACHAGENKPSAVLMAMGIPEADAMSSLRLSTGKDTTEEEIKEAVEVIANAVQQLARS